MEVLLGGSAVLHASALCAAAAVSRHEEALRLPSQPLLFVATCHNSTDGNMHTGPGH